MWSHGLTLVRSPVACAIYGYSRGCLSRATSVWNCFNPVETFGLAVRDISTSQSIVPCSYISRNQEINIQCAHLSYIPWKFRVSMNFGLNEPQSFMALAIKPPPLPPLGKDVVSSNWSTRSQSTSMVTTLLRWRHVMTVWIAHPLPSRVISHPACTTCMQAVCLDMMGNSMASW